MQTGVTAYVLSYLYPMPTKSEDDRFRHHEATSPDYHHLLRLFIASFEHSQGDQPLQQHIFDYLHLVNPTLSISAETRDRLIEDSTQIVQFLLGVDEATEHLPFPHLYVNAYAVHRTITPVAWQFSQRLNTMTDKNKQLVVGSLATGILERDYRYLVQISQRRRHRKPRHDYHSGHRLTDAHFSYLCHYALLGHTTGIREFDVLYADVVKRCEELLRERENMPFVSGSARQLEHLVTTYNRHHVEAPVDWRFPEM
jgi:hypothetical protein